MATNNSINNQLGNSLLISSSGAMTLPSQPSFLAYLSTNASAVTGDGSPYTLLCDTEIFDKSSSYNTSTGVFTAPTIGAAQGIYQFDVGVTLAAGTISTSTSFIVKLQTTQFNFLPIAINPNAATISAGLTQTFSLKAQMAPGDTAFVVITVAGLIAATVSIAGGANILTYFSGALLN